MLNRELIVYSYVSHLPYDNYCKGEHPALQSCFTHAEEEVADSPQILQLVLCSPLHQVGQSSFSMSDNLNCLPFSSVSMAVC